MKRNIKSRVREEKVLSDKKMKGRRLRALCTAVILGSVTLGGLSAHAVDIYSPEEFINPDNYSDSSVLNIQDNINLESANLSGLIQNAINVQIVGTGKDGYAIGGSIYNSDNDGRDTILAYGHYTLVNGSGLTFSDANLTTSTVVFGDSDRGGLYSESADWNLSGGLVQNVSGGTLTVQNSKFDTGLSIDVTRRNDRSVNARINGGIFDNGAGKTTIETSDFTGNAISNSAKKIGEETLFTPNKNGSAIESHINGGLISNASGGLITLNGSNLSSNGITASSSNNHADFNPVVWDAKENCDGDTSEAYVSGGLLNNGGTLTINGGSISYNNISATASSLSSDVTIASVLGGVLYNTGTATLGGGLTISVNSVTYSASRNDGGDTTTNAYGGVVYNVADATLNLGNVTISKNSVSGVAGNVAGGAIYNLGSMVLGETGASEAELVLRENFVSGGSGSASGGAIYSAGESNLSNGKITFANNYATSNSADASGGALYNTGILTLGEADFTENYVTGNNALGGALYNSGTFTLDKGTFSENYLIGANSEQGGAIYNAGTLNLGDVTFSDNTVGDSTLNDIYFAAQRTDGDATVNSTMNVLGRAEIGSGLQSADSTAQINIQNGGNLVLVGQQTLEDGGTTVGNNSGYKGTLNVENGGILTLKGTEEADTLAAALTKATKNWEVGSGLAFDIENDIAARPGQDNPPVAPDATISAADITNILGSDAKNVDIYKLGDNYITFSDDYSSVGRNVYVKDGTMRFFKENSDTEGGGEKYFNGGNANTYISDGAKFIFEISGEDNDTTFAGNLISETVAGEVNKAEFQKAGEATMTLTGDNSAFNGEAVVEWGELVIGGNKSFFGENASIVVDCQRNFSGDTGMASLTYNNVAGGEFNQNITLKSEGILSINGAGRGDSNAITINDTITSYGTNNVINLSGADYTLNTNLDSGQNLNFSNAGITLGSGVTSLEHAITLASGSTLNLADGTANNYTFGDVTLKDATNNATLDINLDGASDAIAVGGKSTGVLNIADLNFSGTGGGAIQKEIKVITGSNNLTFDENYKDAYDSGVYVYDVTTKGGSLSLIASAISANGLKYQNHVVDGKRTFTFVGNNPYTIGEDLETTLAGDFTVSGKSDNASDSVFSGGNAHSFFEVSTDTTLTLENLTIQNALASDADDGTDGASANENGAVVSATGGTVNLNNVALKDNHADGNGGAIYAAGNAIIKGTSVNLSGNTADGQGSAIYAQEGAQITLEDSVIDGSDYVIYNNGAAITLNDTSVSGTDSKIYNSGTLNINSVDKNVITSAIENAGTLNLSAAADKELSISGVTGTGAEIAYNIINVNSDASKTGRVELGDVSKSTLAVGNGTAELGALSDVDLSINNAAVVEHISGNITDGSITIAQSAILKELGTADTTISSVLHGSGTIQKDGVSTLTLSGSGNGADFAGDINVNDGKLVFNEMYGLNAGADVNIKNAVVEYTTGNATLSNDTLANINLNGDAQFTVDANGATVTIADKFWTAKDATTNNNLNFNNGAYNLGFSTAGLADVLNFTDANITLSKAANGSITMNNSTLDLSKNRNAGDNYTFDNLNATQGTNNISLDLDLYVTQDGNPIADTINATAGEGILNLTKVFITNDNGQIFRFEDKNKIQVISGNNDLKIATADDMELLSWATNVYKYQINSAMGQKGIEISYGGPSSTDTLRDLNIYNSGKQGMNNRGFNFVIDDESNSYNIYRDLDTTTEGNFTIIGAVNGNGAKSVLSGELKDLVLDAGTVANRLDYNEDDNTYTYKNADGSPDRTFDASYVTDTADGGKIINVEAMSDGDKNGSFFELTNATNLEISDVIIKDAYRGASELDTNGFTKYGSVIYAMNQDAVVNLSNVDFVSNNSEANGGAIGNVFSKEFNITNGSFDDNHSEKGLGGAIYTAFNMNIKDTDFGVNGRNTHQDGVANDIYIAGNTVTFEVSDKNTNTINSGLAGVAGTVFDKTGAGTLLLNGNNEDMFGSLKISAGEVKYTADGSEDSFIGGSTEIKIDSKLTMDIANSADIQGQIINNLSGNGQLVKTNNGTLKMTGDNHLFTGTMAIEGGSVDFTYEAGKNIYIAGLTDIGENGILNYSTDSEITLSNVSGTGLLNKNGSGNLNFNYMTDNGEKFNGTAYANEGTLTVNAYPDSADDNAFDFKMVANGGDIVYNAIAGQTYVLDSTSNISFADDVNTGSVTFNNGIYELGSALAGQTGDKEVIFDGNDTTSTTIHLTSTEYNTGKFTIKDALIDVADDAFKTYTFDNLNAEEGSELSVDLAFDTANGHQSDKIISTNGSGTLTLTTLNLRDVFYDDGLTTPPDSVEFEILGGGLKLSDLTLDDWATDVYHYTVTTDADKQSVILTADDIAHENSLREQNKKDDDIRGFQFLKEDEYVIGSHLGQTADGIFTVQGIQKGDGSIISHINGGNQYSMFDVVNDNTDLRINDVEISHANKDGNGSVLSHTSDSVATITNAYIHDNASTGKGGAIYVNSGTVNLEDVTFANNNHGNGANDIYIEGENTKVNYIATNDSKNSISSGIAGDGVLEKTGDSELTLSGSNENFTGNLVVSSGTLNFEQNSSTDTYIKGTTTIANAAEVVINTDLSEITTGAFAGGASSTITKTGDYDITLSGDNSQFKGTANINAGNVIWNTDDATFFGGKTNLAKAEYGIVIEGTKDAQLSNISGVGTVGKDNSGTLVLSGDNSDFHGSLAVNQGTLAIAAGTQLGNLNTGAFGNGTSINLQNTAAVENEDGSWTTNPNPASIENLNFETLEIDGDVSLYLDVDLAKEQADKISADNVTVNNNGHLVIGPDGINLVSDALVKNVSTQIVSGNIAQYVMLDDAARTAMGPIQKYMVDYANGYLSFAAQGGNTPSYGDVNPGIMASPVAAQLGGYLVQLHSYDEAFRNMDMYMLMTKEQRQAMKMKNQIASAAKNSNIVLDPTVSRYENKSGWFRPYATFENVSLDNGPKVSNVAYGSFFGAESEMYDLGHGWDGIWSVYGGYNGSHQAYDGVGIYQNGGTLGIVGMAYKGNFFTGLTANTGASVGEAQTGFGQDNFTMLMAGIASKSGYNVEFAKGKLIIQPNFTMSYSYVNTFDYHSAAGVSISSDPLHAIHLEPGIKVIGNLKNGWQPYGSVSMIWNIMDNTQFMANQVYLPELSVKPFVKYGVGVRKSWGEKFTGFFQTYITNGGRNGVGLQLGFRWMLGDKSSNKKTTSQTPQNKKVIKSMK